MTSIRHLRSVGPPLGGYLRPGHRDSALLANLITQGFDVASGVVLDPAAADRTEELRGAALTAGMEVVVDPRTVELALPGGFTRTTVASLPWAGQALHTAADLTGVGGDSLCRAIASHVVEVGATAVLAPTHYISGVPSWLSVDAELTRKLRSALDVLGAQQVAIYYPLVSTLKAVASGPLSDRVVSQLESLASGGVIDAIWLRLHPFGTNAAGPVNLRRYLSFAINLQSTGLPVVGERTGTIGLALLAFSAVGAIESSVTYGDRFDVGSLKRPGDGPGFIPPPRVYLASVGAMVERREAEALFAKRGIRSRHVCQGSCCPRGVRDMIADPRRHFVITRSREIAALSVVPAGARPEHYLTTWLRPASDRAVQLAEVDQNLARDRLRLDSWRVSLSAILEDSDVWVPRNALVPTGRRSRSSVRKAQ